MRHKYLIVEKYDEDVKVNVIYFKEIGFQRKGMSSKFYKDSENGKPYLDLDTMKKAYSYLKGDHINSLEELRQNFQKFFIEAFIEGESIFYASW